MFDRFFTCFYDANIHFGLTAIHFFFLINACDSCLEFGDTILMERDDNLRVDFEDNVVKLNRLFQCSVGQRFSFLV